MVKTLYFQCGVGRGCHGFDPWLGNLNLTFCTVWGEKQKKSIPKHCHPVAT